MAFLFLIIPISLILFFSFIAVFIFFILSNFQYCHCKICSAYLNSSWSRSFDNLCDWYAHLLRNSPTKTIQIHVLNNTITANPTNVEYMLKTNFDNFPKGKPFSAILGDFLGRGIFNVDGDLWRFQKKMASLELDHVSVRSYAFDIVRHEIEHRLIPVVSSVSGRNSDALDLQDLFKRFAFDTICRFSFGLDPRCLEVSVHMSAFADAFDLASRLSAERALSPLHAVWRIKRLLNVGSEKRLRNAITLINVLAEEVIRQRARIGFSQSKDLLSRFMRSTKDKRFLRDIVISFLLAGRDTVASGLTSLLWLVAKYPDVATRIREEADWVIGSDREPENLEEMRKLTYLSATVYESMRLFPPVQFDSKFCLNDDVLPDGSFVKKGTRVTYHPYAMGRVTEIWGSDCSEFRPERWIGEDDSVVSVNAFKYPVFQGGVRVCLGKEMALLELKSVVLALVRRFEFELATAKHAATPRFSPGLTATFGGGLQVFVRKLESH